MALKDELEVDLSPDGPRTLLAGTTLCKFDEAGLFFVERGCRHPLGIYNVSISRIVDRANRFSAELHGFFTHFKTIKDAGVDDALKGVEEKLEMFVYAMAEHVDDCETILKTLFRSDNEFAKSKAVRRFKESTKTIRRDTSLLANAIKHNHQRVRFFESEFFFAADTILLLGFFLEKFKDGALRPDPNFLGPGKKVASCVGFLWSSVLNVIKTSHNLQEAMLELKSPTIADLHSWTDSEFRKLVGSIGRLPLYVFDDENPFQNVSLKLVAPDAELRKEALTASFYNPATKARPLGAGSFSLRYVGDGVTRTFDFAVPTRAVFPTVESGR